MLIELRTATLEIILSLRVYDTEHVLIPRVVAIDTESKMAKQCFTKDGKVLFKKLPFSTFEFSATPPILVQDLLDALPVELHDHVVSTFSG
jgi:hypothetical protein